MRSRPDREVIQDAWIEQAIAAPLREQIQTDGRIRRWVRIPEFENRALRVILLLDAKTVHNAFFDQRLNQMKIKYFEDTDTALLELGSGTPAETRELSEDIYLDLDADGHIVSITVEHASQRGDLSEISFQRLSNKAKQKLEPTR
jgi:uncharacterized protein YuzE